MKFVIAALAALALLACGPSTSTPVAKASPTVAASPSAAPTEAPTTTPSPVPVVTPVPGDACTYVVQKGDNLWSISKAHHVSWHDVWARSHFKSGNPRRIYAGEKAILC